MTKGEIAKSNFLMGYNCSQAVVLAFCEDFGLDKNTALMLASSFGGGMGRMREVCGTVSAMYMILGLAHGYTNPKAKDEKASLYKEVQDLAAKFKEYNRSIICRELLNLRIKDNDDPIPSERTSEYYSSRPCPELCRYAADLIDGFLKEHS